MMLLTASAALWAMAAAGSSFCDGWTPAWSDEFDGTSLDLTSWNVVTGQDGGSCRSAYCSPDNVVVANGTLTLTSRRQQLKGYNYTTAAVNSMHKRFWPQTPTYRLCASAILPGVPGKAQGVWPAIWMMPNDNSCDPDEGEMDILEMIDGDGVAQGTYHFQTTWPAHNCSYPTGHEEATASLKIPTWNSEFHEYAVERSASHVAFVYDGVTVLNASASADHVLLWPMPFYVILNTAIGGPWPGEPNADTVFPIAHVIDYVRVVVQPGAAPLL